MDKFIGFNLDHKRTVDCIIGIAARLELLTPIAHGRRSSLKLAPPPQIGRLSLLSPSATFLAIDTLLAETSSGWELRTPSTTPDDIFGRDRNTSNQI